MDRGINDEIRRELELYSVENNMMGKKEPGG
jgi:hypothetical protein